MSFISARALARGTMLAVVLGLAVTSQTNASDLPTWLFWNEIGNQLGSAAQSHADYEQERQLWREKIAAAEAELARCGGCASAREELEKWRGVENRFQDVAGSLAQAVGMPPIIARWLDIDLPMTSGRTEEQRLEACEIVRGEWVDDLPEFCRIAVDDYLSCLVNYERTHGYCSASGSTSGAKLPGGQCWDQWKLRDHCGKGDYAAFERERAIQDARASGVIVPEYIPGAYVTVWYGPVPDDFLPKLPPADVVTATLKEGNRIAASFLMKKNERGRLNEVTVRAFHYSLVDPNTRCFSLDRPTSGVGRRACDDFYDMNRLHAEDRMTLICSYVGETGYAVGSGAPMPQHIFWYGSRSEIAEPANLLSRSHGHPMLRIGEPRTDCPATVGEANEIAARRSEELVDLARQVPEVPSNVVITRPESQQQLLDQRQKELDAERRRAQAAETEMATFPLEGAYVVEMVVDGAARSGECTIVRRASRSEYAVACRENSNELTARGDLRNGALHVRWPNGSVGKYTVDLPYREAGHGDAMIGKARNGSEQERLVRTGDLVQFRRFPLEGIFDLELSRDGVSMTARCTITSDAGGEWFPTHCTTDDGDSFKSTGVLHYHGGRALWFNQWQPPGMKVGGRSPSRLYFVVDTSFRADSPDTAVLIGYDLDTDVTGRMVRRGDLEADAPVDQRAREMPSTQNGRQQAPDEQQAEEMSREEASRAEWEARQEKLRKEREDILKKREQFREERRAEVRAQRAAREQARLETGTDERARVDRPAASAAPAACTVEIIAGAYRSAHGPIECHPGGGGLECCYGGSCNKMLHLKLDEDQRRLAGVWEYASGVKGPAEFDVTTSCELGDGRWGYDATRAPRSAWRVTGRATPAAAPVTPDEGTARVGADRNSSGVERKLASYEGMDAIADDDSVCRDPLPLIIRAPTASAFTGRQGDVERLVGGIRAILSFECSGKTMPQSFVITGEAEGQVVIRGSADASGLTALTAEALQ